MLGWWASAPDLEEDGQGGTRHKGKPYLAAGVSWHLAGLVGPQPRPEAPALLTPSFHEGSTVCPDVCFFRAGTAVPNQIQKRLMSQPQERGCREVMG